MFKVFVFLLSLIIGNNISFAEEKTVNSVVKATVDDQTPRESKTKSSEDLASEFLKRHDLTKGDNGDLFIAVGTAYVKAKRPKRKSFQVKRRLLVSEASLNAKKDFIEFIRTDMSAEDIIVQPETPFDTKFDNLVTETQEKVEEAYYTYIDALAKVDEASAAKLEDVSYEILAKEGIMAAIKKVNPDLDMAAVEAKIAKKNAQLAEELKSARTSLVETQTNLDSVKAELKKIKGSLLKENTSVVETLSQMNVVGLFPIANFESWDGEQYSTTIICIWSTKEEKRARAMMSGEKIDFEPTEVSIVDFLENQDWSSAQGMRKIVDNRGNFWLLSISSAIVKGASGSQMNKTKGLAQLNAKKQLAYALFSDAKSKEKAMEKMQEIAGKGGEGDVETQTATSFSKELRQSVENLQIQGMSEKWSKQLIHPISGQKIYVSVVGISHKSVAKAKLMEISQARATRAVIRANQKSKGVKAGIEKAIDEQKKDKSAYNEGVKKGYTDAKKTETVTTTSPSKSESLTSGKTKKGGFSGGGVTSGAFK
jgi:hypothetical protein